MRQIFLLFLLTLVSSCGKENDPEITDIFSNTSERWIASFAINPSGEFYFITNEVDKSVYLPPWSSYLPVRTRLFRQSEPNGRCVQVNSKFTNAYDIWFDKESAMIVMSTNTLFKSLNNRTDTIGHGEFSALAIGPDNSLWAGGYNTGIVKFDENLSEATFNVDNSCLPAMGINCLDVSNTGIVWAALGSGLGVVRLYNNECTLFGIWEDYEHGPDIWSIAANGNEVWIGTGSTVNSMSVFRYNGSDWANMSPMIDNLAIPGIVRKIKSFRYKVYAIIENYENHSNHSALLVYESGSWIKENIFPSDRRVVDMEIDSLRNKLWILTERNGLYSLNL